MHIFLFFILTQVSVLIWGREKGTLMWERNMDQFPLIHCPNHWTHKLLACRMMPQPTEPPGQGIYITSFKNRLIFRRVLVSQHNWEECTVIPHKARPPHRHSLPECECQTPERSLCYNWWTCPDSSFSPGVRGSHYSPLSVVDILWVWINVWHVSTITVYRVFLLPYKYSCSTYSSSPSPQSLVTTDLFTFSIVLPFPGYHTLADVLYVAISDWLLSPSNMHLSFLSVFSWPHSSFFFLMLNNILLSRHTSLSIRLLMDSSCFQVLATMSKAVTNICEQVAVWTEVFNLCG